MRNDGVCDSHFADHFLPPAFPAAPLSPLHPSFPTATAHHPAAGNDGTNSLVARSGDLMDSLRATSGVASPISSEQFANLNASSSVAKSSGERKALRN